MKKITLATAMIAVLSSGTAMASVDFGVGLKGGTFGTGFEAGMQITPKFKVRFQNTGFTYNYDETVDGNAYNGDIKLGGSSLLLDYHPFDGGFHFSGGLVTLDSSIVGTARNNTNTTFQIGDTVYNSNEIASASFSLKPGSDSASYLGFGWGSIADQDPGLSFNFEIGVVMMDSPKVNFSVEENVLTAQQKADLQNDIDKETANIENDIKDFDMWPVIAIGLAYHF